MAGSALFLLLMGAALFDACALADPDVRRRPDGGRGAGGAEPTGSCPGCGRHELDADERRRLMIELAKIKLLNKLNLRQAPSFRAADIKPIPVPLLSTITREKQQEESHTSTNIHSKTQEKVVLLGEEVTEYHLDDIYLSRSRHFGFRLYENLFQYDVRSASFWIAPVTRSISNTSRCTLYVSDTHGAHRTTVEFPGVPGHIVEKGRLHRRQADWMRFDVTHSVRKWMTHRRRHRRFTVTCLGCVNDAGEQLAVPIRTDAEFRPFLEIDARKRAPRRRRSISVRRLNGGCYLEELYVNFTEIGWHTWIRHPAGYSANYCRGTCVHHNVLTTYNGILMEVVKSRPTDTRLESLLAPCCAAIETGSISILYEVEPNQYIYEKLDGMVASKCDCR